MMTSFPADFTYSNDHLLNDCNVIVGHLFMGTSKAIAAEFWKANKKGSYIFNM